MTGPAIETPSEAAAPLLVPPPPGMPPGFLERWPTPQGPPRVSMAVAVAVTAVAAGIAVPSGPMGIGWALTVTVGVLAAGLVSWRTRGMLVTSLTLRGIGWSLATVALAAVSTVRAAEWLGVLCLLAAFGTAAVAASGRSVRGIGAALGVATAASVRAIPWFATATRRVGDVGRAVRVIAAVAVAAALLAIFVPLMATADATFGALVAHAVPDVDGGWVLRWVLLAGFAGTGMGGACFLVGSAPTPLESVRPRTRLGGLEWTVPVGLLTAVFGLFVGVQLATLFGSDELVRATTGLTYAEYARGGFWQLLWITVLAFGVIVAAARLAPAAAPRQRAWKRGLLAALSVLVLVVVASAAHRMVLYQEAYGFTVWRLLVLSCEIWLGVGFLLVLGSVLRLQERAPTRAMLATGVLTLLVLAVLNPDRLVAEGNIARYAETGRIDVEYLSRLSADAVPALVTLPEPKRSCALRSLVDGPEDDWRSANLGRAAARAALAGVRVVPGPSCDDYSRDV